MSRSPKAIYLKLSSDDWLDMILGTLFWVTVYGAIGYLIFRKLGMSKEVGWTCIFLLVVFIIYQFWKDVKYEIIETNLSENGNLNLLRGTFNKLGWSTQENPQEIIIWEEKSLSKIINARVVYSNAYVGFNFRYKSNKKFGRPPFLIGFRTYLKWKFERQLRSMLENMTDNIRV